MAALEVRSGSALVASLLEPSCRAKKLFNFIDRQPAKKTVIDLIREGEVYEVFCSKRIFYFGEVDGEYKLTGFGVDY